MSSNKSLIATAGLAESLRQELLLYNIDVHMYFPATIDSPGYVEENKTKPKITLKIEESDPLSSPDDCAEGLWNGNAISSARGLNLQLTVTIFNRYPARRLPHHDLIQCGCVPREYTGCNAVEL